MGIFSRSLGVGGPLCKVVSSGMQTVSLHSKAPKDLQMFCSHGFLVSLQRKQDSLFSAFWVQEG